MPHATTGARPSSPTALSKAGWGRALRTSASKFRRDNVSDLAAALTYYGVLAIFPAVIVEGQRGEIARGT